MRPTAFDNTVDPDVVMRMGVQYSQRPQGCDLGEAFTHAACVAVAAVPQELLWMRGSFRACQAASERAMNIHFNVYL